MPRMESRCQCHRNTLSMEVTTCLTFLEFSHLPCFPWLFSSIRLISSVHLVFLDFFLMKCLFFALDRCNWRGGSCYGRQVLESEIFPLFSRNCFHLFQWKIISDTVGPMATITDSLFSLIIFIYVMVTFLYLFYGFCWIDAPKKTEAEIEEENKLVGNLGCAGCRAPTYLIFALHFHF